MPNPPGYWAERGFALPRRSVSIARSTAHLGQLLGSTLIMPFPKVDLPPDVVEQLLTIAVDAYEKCADLGERRRAVLKATMELVQADSGIWSWGRGWPQLSGITPVALIDAGFDPPQRAKMIEWALSPAAKQEFVEPIRTGMGNETRSAVIRRDMITDESWDTHPDIRRKLAQGGWGGFVHALRYSDRDTWSNFFLLRNEGRAEFGRREAAIADVMLNGIRWMQSTAEEYLEPETFAALTPRQRAVMLHLLDGLARKTIALRLGISEETVGDHLKAIYRHFDVGSASELAAKFLRSR